MLYPGIVALNPLTGEYVVKVAETDDNSIMEIWLESPDTFLKIYTEAGTLDVEGNTLFPNLKDSCQWWRQTGAVAWQTAPRKTHHRVGGGRHVTGAAS